MLTLSEVDLKNKRVLVRADLNVPVDQGRITSDFRLKNSLPTIQYALKQGARVAVMSHLGRPKEGVESSKQPEFSLSPVAKWLKDRLDVDIQLVENWEGGVNCFGADLALLENIRFKPGETSNDPRLASELARLCDIFVMDAFGVSHRKHASSYGAIKQAPVACAGLLMTAELAALEDMRKRAQQPLIAVIGGAKVSTKLAILQQLGKIVDRFIVGGGVANTLLLAAGYSIGQSFHEPGCLKVAEEMLDSGQYLLPSDVLVLREKEHQPRILPVTFVQNEDRILDIGPETQAQYARHIQQAGSIIWNGPMGVFELDDFVAGTRAVARAIGDSKAFSVAGGGDTLAAIEALDAWNGISLISTGGGAFLKLMEGKSLPAVEALNCNRSTAKQGD